MIKGRRNHNEKIQIKEYKYEVFIIISFNLGIKALKFRSQNSRNSQNSLNWILFDFTLAKLIREPTIGACVYMGPL